VRPNNRLKIYLAAAAVTALSATQQTRSVTFREKFAATAGDIFFWNFVMLAILVVIVELFEWPKRRPPRGS
jgi:hypothetical protein